MKLAILKFIVYVMGILLVGSVLFLGYAIYKKIQNPAWRPTSKIPLVTMKPQDHNISFRQEELLWPQECLEKKKIVTAINPDRIAVYASSCHFVDIFDGNGGFINRIDLKGE